MKSFRKKTRAEWRKIVAAWKESGLAVDQYCLAQGITKGRFYCWRKQFGLGFKPEQSIRALGQDRKLPATFLPVQVREVPTSEITPKVVVPQRIEVFLGNGSVVRFSGELSDESLSHIMHLAAGAQC